MTVWAIERRASLASHVSETWVYGVDAAVAGVGLVMAQKIHQAPLAPLALLPLLGVLEADDSYTGEHCKSVVSLCLAVAECLGLDPAQRRNLEFGALLHDVGKIAIPKEIINKPGKLDLDEWTIIKTHTIEGQRMLERVGGFMRQVGLIVRSHVACCDTWNAMRTDRAYRKALAYDVALAELRAASGAQLDPGIVTLVIELVEADRRAEAALGEQRGAPAQPVGAGGGGGGIRPVAA